MSELMEYLKKKGTVVVFDIDGVLAAYEFGYHCHAAVPGGDWRSYVEIYHPYLCAKPLPALEDFVVQKDPDELYICSVAADFEQQDKRVFCERCYGINPGHIHFVASKAEKLRYVTDLAEQLKIPQERVALVEDSVKTLDQLAAFSHCTTVHITSFFYG